MCSELFVILLFAHVLGDFYLQTDKCCEDKRRDKFRSWFLYIHPVIIGALSWLLVWKWSFAICALAIVISHFAIDAAKCFAKNNLISFVLDQLLHICVIAAVCFFWNGTDCWMFPMWYDCLGYNFVLKLTGAIILYKPANILIKLTLTQYKITESDAKSNRVGSLIGGIERLLAYLFFMIGELNAVGFLLAAKSILRFRDADTVKTEYVLAGTLLSFGIAVVVGILILNVTQ